MQETSPSPGKEPRAAAPAPVDNKPLQAPGVPQQPAPVPVPSRPAPFSPRTRVAVLAVGLFLLFLLLLKVAGILTPFMWAVVVAYAFNPLVTSLTRRTRLPRALIVIGMYVAGIAALVVLLSVAIPRLNEQVAQLNNDAQVIANNLLLQYFGTSSPPLVIGGFSIDIAQTTRAIAHSFNSALNNVVGGTFSAVVVTIERLTQFLLFMIVSFYLLLDAPKFGDSFLRGVPRRHRDEVLEVAHQVDACLTQYLRAELVLIAIMTVASFIVLSIMGVRFAIVLAPIAGVLEIFPFIGPFAAITLVTLIALFSTPNYGLSHSTSALVVALTFFVLRQIEDYAVIPNVVGHAVRLHPVLILFAVTAGASFGGALGLFVAVPVTGALKVLATYLYQKIEPV